MVTLEHAFGASEVAQAVLTEIDELVAVIADEFAGGERDHDLITVRDRHEPCRAIHRAAVVVAVAHLGDARVHTHPDPQRFDRVPVLVAQRELPGNGGVDRVGRGGERCVDTVAGGLHEMAAVGLDRLAQQVIVAGQGVAHRVGKLLPQDASNPRDP